MLNPDPTTAPDPASPESPFELDPLRAEELRRQLRGLALALFSWTANPVDPRHSTASERLLAAALKPWLPKLRDALLSRLDSADPAALEATMGATATALESMLWYAPGRPLPRFTWTMGPEGFRLTQTEGAPDGQAG